MSASRTLENVVNSNMRYFKKVREKMIEARREKNQKAGGRNG
jgi:hypothetical protein